MRIRRRYAILAVASVAALAVGGVASANHISNTSSVAGSKITPSNLPKTTRVPITLFTHTHTNYAHPGNKTQGGFAKTVTVMYDDDGTINLTGVPRCAVTDVANKTIAQAYAACGPAGKNAYMSPAGTISGRASTAPPSNFGGCTMVFNGPGANQVLLYTRVTTVPNSNPSCTTSNNGGNVTVTLIGTISNAGVADFGKKLTVPNIDQLTLPLDDFTATVKRGSVFTARCNDANRILNIRGIFAYSGTGQPPDTVNSTQTCTVR